MHYSEITPEFKEKFFELIDQAKRVIITGHRAPDDDAISSALAMYDIVKQKYPSKDTRIIFSWEPIDTYNSFKNYDKIEFVDDIADQVEPTDTLLVVDGSQYHRFSPNPEKLAKVQTAICIDHHSSPAENFALSLIVPDDPACVEVIYKTFYADTKPNKDQAEIFLMGILGDTGNMAYLKPSQTGTLLIVKDLLDICQVELQEFLARFQTITPKQFEVLKEFIKNTAYGKADGWPDFQYSFISRDFVSGGGYSENDVSVGSDIYSTHYLRKIAGYGWGFTLKPRGNGEATISARSLPGSVNVRQMLEDMQVGGGHNRAAGGKFADTKPEDAIKRVVEWINTNKPALG